MITKLQWSKRDVAKGTLRALNLCIRKEEKLTSEKNPSFLLKELEKQGKKNQT